MIVHDTECLKKNESKVLVSKYFFFQVQSILSFARHVAFNNKIFFCKTIFVVAQWKMRGLTILRDWK